MILLSLRGVMTSGGVAKVETSQGLRNGRMPRILDKDYMFEEHEAEDAKEVVLEYDCCDEEFPTSLETTESHETVGDALQSQPCVDAPLPSAAVNSVERIVK